MLHLFIFVIGGLALSLIFNLGDVESQRWYLLTVAGLLAIGLYGSTFGIAIKEARQQVRLILKAVTIGVLLKAIIIGSLVALVMRDPFGFVLGIIVAQIDPLSTAALMENSRMSKRAKAILAAWSSFDDPMTVIMALYVPVLVAMIVGGRWEPIQGSVQELGLAGYLAETGINLLFAGGIFVLWRLMKRHARASNYVVIALVALGMYGLLIGVLSVAVYFFWMLGIAVVGLFMRPPIQKALEHAVHWALSMAAILLGILLINGVNVVVGLVLGLAAFGSQIIVGYLLTRKLPENDRLHIAFAQQNGITSIILALLFEPYYPGTIAIAAPAILVINSTHALANKILGVHLAHDFKKLKPVHHMERLRSHVHKI